MPPKTSLITDEDPFHLHKILGILCLVSYLYRFSLMGNQDMGFVYTEWTLPTILLHLSLNLTSFVFRIPIRRINSGYRIWPEYRLHSLVFLCRSLACIAVHWYEQVHDIQPNYALNYVIVISSMLAADWSSSVAGEQYRSGFCRDLSVPNYVKFFFSVMQINATAGCLYIKRSSIHFTFCFIIQLNAFLMTLRRKNVASHHFLIAIYAALLVLGFGVSHFEMMALGPEQVCVIATVGNLAAVLRLGPWSFDWIRNKYVLWTVMGLLLRQLRTSTLIDHLQSKGLLVVFPTVSVASVAALGFYQNRHGYEKKKTA